jgi:hypothetical protein
MYLVILLESDDVDWLDSFCSWQGQVAGSCKHGNEPSRSIKGGEFHY